MPKLSLTGTDRFHAVLKVPIQQIKFNPKCQVCLLVCINWSILANDDANSCSQKNILSFVSFLLHIVVTGSEQLFSFIFRGTE